MAKKKSISKIMEELALEHPPHVILNALANTYWKILKQVEPSYTYLSPEDRENGRWEKPETAAGWFWLRAYLAINNVTIGLSKWWNQYRRGVIPRD